MSEGPARYYREAGKLLPGAARGCRASAPHPATGGARAGLQGVGHAHPPTLRPPASAGEDALRGKLDDEPARAQLPHVV